MIIAKALERAKKDSEKKGRKVDIDIEIPIQDFRDEVDPEQVPMMYRAQTSGRCSIQFASNNQDLEDWTEEWVYPDPSNQRRPHYQFQTPPAELGDSIHRVEIEFPFRICSNCGQDSIIRPVIGKDGIPFIPGSSIKGLFRRLAKSKQIRPELQQKVIDYCGNEEKSGILRFHRAYPVGDWAGTNRVKKQDGKEDETRYRMVDVVHPQWERQVGKGKSSPKAIALISLYNPTMIFEISSHKPIPPEEWEIIKGLLKRSLRQGLGGKTSTGYGYGRGFVPQDRYALDIRLHGVGVSSFLRSDEPEFRPNIFKASLRSHACRLLAGVSRDRDEVEKKIGHLFGHTKAPGCLQLHWETKSLQVCDRNSSEVSIYGEHTPIYQVRGDLHMDAPTKDLDFCELLVEFAYTMGGFGKSWRRVWHKGPKGWHSGFCPTYITRAIGCHWEWKSDDSESFMPKSTSELKDFLKRVRDRCVAYIEGGQDRFLTWREAWYPERVAVYSRECTGTESRAIQLFHQPKGHPFKTTPAICGKKQVRKKEYRNGREVWKDILEFSISSVWHRMLPIDDNRYLEIVTVFHGNGSDRGDPDPWQHQHDGDQLQPFIERLKGEGLQLAWGKEPSRR